MKTIFTCRPGSRSFAILAIVFVFASFLPGCGGSDDGTSAPQDFEGDPTAEIDAPADSDAALDEISDISTMKRMEYSQRTSIANAADEGVAPVECPVKLAARLVEFHVTRGGRNSLPVWELCTLLGKDKAVLKGNGPVFYRAEKVASGLYQLYAARSDSPRSDKTFSYIISDGKSLRRVVEFGAVPSDKTIRTIVESTRDSAALNDLAALIFNGEEKCLAADKAYCEKLLQNAALDGEWMACRNLAFLYKLEGDKDRSLYWASLAEKVFQRSIPGEIRKPMKQSPISAWPVMSEAIGF